MFRSCSLVVLNNHSLQFYKLPPMNSHITARTTLQLITATVTAHG